MRSQEERRHFDRMAASRQLKIGRAVGSIDAQHSAARQPGRLTKLHATVAGAARPNSAPHLSSAPNVHELSALEAERLIEAGELQAISHEARDDARASRASLC